MLKYNYLKQHNFLIISCTSIKKRMCDMGTVKRMVFAPSKLCPTGHIHEL